jgi:general secretion pathway protein D
MLGQLAEQSRPPVPPSANAATATAATAAAATSATASLAPVTLAVVPPVVNQAVGSTFQVALTVSNARDLASVPVQLHFDPKLLSLVDVDAGELLGRGGQTPAVVHRDEGNGNVTISASRASNVQGVDGQGTVCTLTFKALAAGDASLSLVKIGAKDSKQNSLNAVGSPATVHLH